MKARRLGTDSPFVEIDMVQLKDRDVLYKAEAMEFEHNISTELQTNDQMSECTDWNYYRIHAAIAAIQGLISNRVYADYMARKSKEDGFKFSDAISEDAVEMADALIEQLKKEKT